MKIYPVSIFATPRKYQRVTDSKSISFKSSKDNEYGHRYSFLDRLAFSSIAKRFHLQFDPNYVPEPEPKPVVQICEADEEEAERRRQINREIGFRSYDDLIDDSKDDPSAKSFADSSFFSVDEYFNRVVRGLRLKRLNENGFNVQHTPEKGEYKIKGASLIKPNFSLKDIKTISSFISTSLPEFGSEEMGCVVSDYFSKNYTSNPRDYTPRHVIEARKRVTAEGLKGYLDSDDFYWHYDKENGIASSWMINGSVFAVLCYEDKEMKYFIDCIAHLDYETIKRQIFNPRNFSYSEKCSIENGENAFECYKAEIVKAKKRIRELPGLISKLNKKFLAGDSELVIQKQEIQSRLFDAIEKREPEVEVPNGIFIFGKAAYAKDDLYDWIKAHSELRFKQISFAGNNYRNAMEQLSSAIQEAESYWSITGKRTIIDISKFDSLLTQYNSRENRILISQFKNLVENASKHHVTLLIKTDKEVEEFEPSSISGQRFGIKARLDYNSISPEEVKELEKLIEEYKYYEDCKYYLQDYCVRAQMYCPELKADSDYEDVFIVLNNEYKLYYEPTEPTPQKEKITFEDLFMDY